MLSLLQGNGERSTHSLVKPPRAMELGLDANQSNGKGLPLEVSGKSGLVLQVVLQ